MRVWTSLRPAVRGAVTMVVAAALVLALVGAGRNWIDQRDRADPGRLPDWVEVAPIGDTEISVLIPSGRVDVSVGTTQEKPLADEPRAPSGGRLVDAVWTHRRADPSAGLEPDKMPDPVVWVRSGGQRERVTGSGAGVDSNEHGGVFAFATRDPLVVEVEFAGRRQSVEVASGRRTAGAFASLYRPPPFDGDAQLDTRGKRKGDLDWRSELSVDYYRVPYLHDLGWAKKGREWLVLGRRTGYDVDSFGTLSSDHRDTAYSIAESPAHGSVRVDGGRLVRKPTTTGKSDGDRATYEPTGAVFDIPRGRDTSLTVTLKLQVERHEGNSTTTKPLTVSHAMPLSGALEPAGTDR